jgi:predicted RNA-binding protein with PUA-like domain
MKDKPGPTRLVGGPSMAASELVDMVQDMGTFCWDGVRDEASNAFLRKMRAGDIACLFHGGASERAVVGQMEIVSDPRPDPTAWDPDSAFYDAHSKESKPKWYCVDVRFIKVLPRFLSLAELNMKADELPLHNEMISQPRRAWPVFAVAARLRVLTCVRYPFCLSQSASSRRPRTSGTSCSACPTSRRRPTCRCRPRPPARAEWRPAAMAKMGCSARGAQGRGTHRRHSGAQ